MPRWGDCDPIEVSIVFGECSVSVAPNVQTCDDPPSVVAGDCGPSYVSSEVNYNLAPAENFSSLVLEIGVAPVVTPPPPPPIYFPLTSPPYALETEVQFVPSAGYEVAVVDGAIGFFGPLANSAGFEFIENRSMRLLVDNSQLEAGDYVASAGFEFLENRQLRIEETTEQLSQGDYVASAGFEYMQLEQIRVLLTTHGPKEFTHSASFEYLENVVP